ncbi:MULTISPECIES: cytochrome c-type biogenesis protein [Methylococcus]|jgi:cytochrome c-type biogenesis protein CcmH|uniref:Cytochrome c-type biogenesis protein n=2 Tax=Methylococcus capsulatus TaxID=414 RepID=Q60BP9_METCA|nr:cytochrome c-type biogenesis protein [Methylococcus capsulatus]AAU90424.1 cytochrome c-type biogenesis protein CcmH [Methylococcus capsulatus str. Bath]QXP88761.1 cytochrome c-type biogenesis protein CcmH [Methylococcus capsulatus]QXP94208.1 cytochrome c-type biogenesis protein CcmH [Methylococcus capsulatus]UQN11046.1 cytochrome c-type biogenesis protein CcmH [Methylococcus capsulatus]CAI8767397.1 Cytochrome c-type biogenesis protein CcmH [Methylococcus capsulatus]
MKRLILCLCGMLAISAAEAMEIRQFDDPAKEERYETLIKDLRCLVCQNQSLAESDAELAKDLRTEVYNIIQSGKSSEEAVRFLTERYGDFVLYRPPFKRITLLLWLGPFLLLAGGAVFLWKQARRRAAAAQQDATLSAEERRRLQQLKDRFQG